MKHIKVEQSKKRLKLSPSTYSMLCPAFFFIGGSMKRQIIIPEKKASQPIVVDSATLASPVMFFSPGKHRYNKQHAAIPAQMARQSLFDSVPKKRLGSRLVEERYYENSWGKWTVKGEPLSVYDQKVFFAICMLIYNERWKKQKSQILTTQYELCKTMSIKPTSGSYKLIWDSLERIAETTVNFEDSYHQIVGSTIWVDRDKTTNKILISTNKYFDKMFALELLTRFNYGFYLAIRGDRAKFLYIFLQSHTVFNTGGWYRIGLIKICRALNIETENIALWKLRSTIRKAIASLVNEKYLTVSSCIHTNDVVWFRQPYKTKKNY